MLSSGNNLSALFRSLAPEESDVQAAVKTGEQSVGQEWPLFKVVAPTKPEPTPPLTPQERGRWGVQAVAAAEPPKPALTMSGLSSKLARSLGQISERMVSEAAQPSISLAAEPPMGGLAQPVQDPLTPPKARASLFSKVAPAAESQNKGESGKVIGLFEKPLVQTNQSLGPASDNGKADDSLSSIFSRLGTNGKAVVKPVEKRSSLSTRLGKR